MASAADLESLKKRLETSPDNLKVRHALAKAYLESEKYDLTIEVLKAKAEKLPADSLLLLAQAYQLNKDYLNENKALEQAASNNPTFAPAFVALGDFYYRNSLTKNDPKLVLNAQANYKQAIDLNPTLRPAYDGLLKAYESSKNFYELRILLGDMIKRFGKTTELMSHLCRRNTIDGFFVNARKLCREAITIDAKKPDNYIYLALIENNEGNLKKADSLLKKVTAKFTDSEFAQSNYADFLIQQKNLPGAQGYYKSAAKADSKSFRAQIGLAKTSFELKQYEMALEAYKEACSINPYQTYRLLKKASDWLRHKQESAMENRYAGIMEKCVVSSDETRAPASNKEDYRSPFAIYSKNQVPDK